VSAQLNMSGALALLLSLDFKFDTIFKNNTLAMQIF